MEKINDKKQKSIMFDYENKKNTKEVLWIVLME